LKKFVACLLLLSAQARGYVLFGREIARLGETGLEINNPLKRYSLTNLDGDFSGLQLLCYMHVGMALFDPKVDCGSGLQREYEIARGMTGK